MAHIRFNIVIKQPGSCRITVVVRKETAAFRAVIGNHTGHLNTKCSLNARTGAPTLPWWQGTELATARPPVHRGRDRAQA